MQPEWALALENDEGKIVHASLQRMYRGEEKGYNVSLWFVNRNISLESFDSSCLGPLMDAVADHIPPFHQYLDRDGASMTDFSMERIRPVGSGMYRQYPKLLDCTTKRVENRLGELTLFSLPRRVTWESI